MAQATIAKVLWASVGRRHPMSEQIVAAAAAGFDKLSVAADLYLEGRKQGVKARDLLAMAEDQGVTLDFLDGFCGWAPVQFAAHHGQLVRQVMSLPTEQCLDICAELGLRTIVTMPWFKPGALDVQLLIERFAEFCDRAGKLGISADLEFTPIWGIPDLRTAWQIVDGARRANSTIMLDTWNFAKGDADMELLRQIPAGRIVNIQLTDGFYAARDPDPLLDSLYHREMPAEGEFPLTGMTRILLEKGALRSVGPEVFYVRDDAPSAAAAARHAALRTAQAMAAAGSPMKFDRKELAS